MTDTTNDLIDVALEQQETIILLVESRRVA